MRVKPLAAFAIALGIGASMLGSSAPAIAAPSGGPVSAMIAPMHSKASCDRQMNAGARVCSRVRPLQAAAICHAANMVRYGACLAGAN
jgi:hypothetical protein